MTTDIIEKIKAAGVEVKVLSSAQMQQVLKAYEGRVAGRQAVLSNEPFYSNAEHAVRSIRQDKATPAQWLAMLSKNGGIKAGEDRWLGMTDWLRQSTEKTLTKEHVLNYIEKNRIALHEAYYGEIEQTEDFKKLDDEYRRTINEVEDNYLNADDRLEEFYMQMHEKYEEYGGQWMMDMTEDEKRQEEELLALRDKYDTSVISAEEIAFSEMVEKYGRHFDNAFIGDENGLTVNDEEETRFFIDELPIDPVRREHVTEGLVNYHEIALWAEQADAWMPSDNIHFGDAGGGKCIGWIRFGETTVHTPLSDSEIQHKLEEMPGVEAWVKYDGKQFVNGQDLYYPPGHTSLYVKSPYISKSKDSRSCTYHPLKGSGIICMSLKEAVKLHNTLNVKRTDSQKVLVIDEIQSKRHQEAQQKKADGNKKGYQMSDHERERMQMQYADAYKEKAGYETRMRQKYNSEWFGHYMSGDELATLAGIEDRIRDIHARLLTDGDGIPCAPFEKNWHEVCMKRMLRYAAEKGFDTVAWTKAEQQHLRYNLAKYVDSIYRDRNQDDDKYFIIRYNQGSETGFYVNPEGYIFDSSAGWGGKHINEVVGKDMAERMMAMPENTSMESKDLTIGEKKGMTMLYDNTLVSFMNHYTKKWGTSVGEISFPHLSAQNEYVNKQLTMHCVDVTPAMRESVLQGQPMFMHDHKGGLYGFAVGDTIFLSEKGLNPETVLHEYTHLWAKAMQQGNPQGWQSVKDLLRDTALWREVMDDPLYADIRDKDDLVASEALARISGSENAAKLAGYARQSDGQHPADVFARLKAALERFWAWVGKEMLGIRQFSTVGEVTDRVLYDLMNKTRITDVKLYKDLQGNPCIRCKIDGQQQMGRRVDGMVAGGQMGRDALLHMAESCFAEELNRKYEKTEGKTFKR